MSVIDEILAAAAANKGTSFRMENTDSEYETDETTETQEGEVQEGEVEENGDVETTETETSIVDEVMEDVASTDEIAEEIEEAEEEVEEAEEVLEKVEDFEDAALAVEQTLDSVFGAIKTKSYNAIHSEMVQNTLNQTARFTGLKAPQTVVLGMESHSTSSGVVFAQESAVQSLKDYGRKALDGIIAFLSWLADKFRTVWYKYFMTVDKLKKRSKALEEKVNEAINAGKLTGDALNFPRSLAKYFYQGAYTASVESQGLVINDDKVNVVAPVAYLGDVLKDATTSTAELNAGLQKVFPELDKLSDEAIKAFNKSVKGLSTEELKEKLFKLKEPVAINSVEKFAKGVRGTKKDNVKLSEILPGLGVIEFTEPDDETGKGYRIRLIRAKLKGEVKKEIGTAFVPNARDLIAGIKAINKNIEIMEHLKAELENTAKLTKTIQSMIKRFESKAAPIHQRLKATVTFDKEQREAFAQIRMITNAMSSVVKYLGEPGRSLLPYSVGVTANQLRVYTKLLSKAGVLKKENA